MHPDRTINIAGGGLAGLALALSLVRRGVAARVFESGGYPRHRVCGEFISGRGQEVLRCLGILPTHSGRVQMANSCRFFGPKGAGKLSRLPQPALCISRFSLDALLAEAFVKGGGELLTQKPWERAFDRPGTIRATGRLKATQAGEWRWFGLKAHARNVTLASDLEMHFIPGGYVGLCGVGDGITNVCGLFRTRPGSTTAPSGCEDRRLTLLRGAPGSTLWNRMEPANFVPGSVNAVGALPLGESRVAATREFRIGDALSMIPPITGNGMSMALEAAAIAAEPVAAYSRGELDWDLALGEARPRFERAFQRRLRWARWMHKLLFTAVGEPLSRLCFARDLLFRWTR